MTRVKEWIHPVDSPSFSTRVGNLVTSCLSYTGGGMGVRGGGGGRVGNLVTSCLSYTAITNTYLYNFDTLKPHFYIVKLEFTGVFIIFLISAQKYRLWVLVRTASVRRF